MDRGRVRFHEKSPVDRSYVGPVWVEHPAFLHPHSAIDVRFWATSDPWRLRLEPVHESKRGDYAGLGLYDCHVVTQRTWWLRQGDEFDSGNVVPDIVINRPGTPRMVVYGSETIPDPGNWNRVFPTFRMQTMLRPSRFIEVIRPVRERLTVLYGRSAFHYVGHPGDSYDYYRETGDLAVLGATVLMATVDAQYGFALDTRAYIDDAVACVQRITSLTVDADVEERMFAGPALGRGHLRAD